MSSTGVASAESRSETDPLAGKRARLSLLTEVTSKAPNNSKFLAKLEDAVEVSGQPVLPKGSVFEGHLQTVRAKRLMRAGALRLIFDQVKLPDGTVRPATLNLVAVDSRSVKTDSEGELHPTLGKKRLALQLGGALLVAKVADDIAEEAAASVSPGKARIYGAVAGLAFLVFQKGREVRMNPGDTVEIEFSREGSLLPLEALPQ